MAAQPTQQPVNSRMALAGLNILRGMSLKRGLLAAGYSPKTARNPAWNGLMAQRCIAEAAKMNPHMDPGKLIESARKVLALKLELLEDRAACAKTPASGIARIVEVTEHLHAGHDPRSQDLDARAFGARLAWLEQALAEYRSRTGRELPLRVGPGTEAGATFEAHGESEVAKVEVGTGQDCK